MSSLLPSHWIPHIDPKHYEQLNEIYQKLVELLTKTTSHISELKPNERQEIWLTTVNLWIELTKKIVDNSLTEQRILADCLSLINSLSLQLVESVSIFDEDESTYAMQIFLAYFSILQLPHISTFLNKTDRLPTETIFLKNIEQIIFEITQCATHLPSNINEQLGKYMSVFILLESYIHKRFQSLETRSDSLLPGVLRIFWCVSDHITFIPSLVGIHLPEGIVSWLAFINRTGSVDHAEAVLITIYNLSRHDKGAEVLNKCGTIEHIKEFRSKYLSIVTEEISIVIKMILAHLLSPDEIESDKTIMNATLNRLLQRIINASKQTKSWRERGYHMSEFLVVLVKLFVVEERILDYILCHAETKPQMNVAATIRLFCSILIAFSDALTRKNQRDQMTLTAIVNIIWSISFQTQHISELTTNNQDALDIIKELAETNKTNVIKQYRPRALEKVTVAAHGILHNIQEYCDHYKVSSDNLKTNSNTKPSIMISYCHSDRDFCNKILEYLSTQQTEFDIWIDQTHCRTSGDLWELIAAGIEQSSLVLCLLSEYYFQSKSCRQEFIYSTDTIHKVIVPIIIGDFKPKGWLGIRMPGLKYIRFRNPDDPGSVHLNHALSTILSTLEGSTAALCQQNDYCSNAQPKSELPLNQWSKATKADIRQWFFQHYLSDELRDLYYFQTGDEMLRYAAILITNPEQHAEIYSKEFRRKYHDQELLPHVFQRFVTSMKELLDANSQ